MSGECKECGEHCLDCQCDLESKNMKWINVKDELPKEDKWVLIGSSTHEFVETGMYFEGKFVNPDLNYLHRPTVTHWMSLPEPPTSYATLEKYSRMSLELRLEEKEKEDDVD